MGSGNEILKQNKTTGNKIPEKLTDNLIKVITLISGHPQLVSYLLQSIIIFSKILIFSSKLTNSAQYISFKKLVSHMLLIIFIIFTFVQDTLQSTCYSNKIPWLPRQLYCKNSEPKIKVKKDVILISSFDYIAISKYLPLIIKNSSRQVRRMNDLIIKSSTVNIWRKR